MTAIDKTMAIRIATQLGWVPRKEWHGLTDDEYAQIMQEADRDAAKTGSVFQNLRRAIEAKLKEKNHD